MFNLISDYLQIILLIFFNGKIKFKVNFFSTLPRIGSSFSPDYHLIKFRSKQIEVNYLISHTRVYISGNNSKMLTDSSDSECDNSRSAIQDSDLRSVKNVPGNLISC